MPVTAAVFALLLAGAQAPAQASAPAAATPSFGFERVDILSEDPGVWLHYEAPMIGVYAVAPLLRLVEQTKVVFHLPVENLYAGASITSQSLTYEQALSSEKGLFWSATLQTRLLFPRGLNLGLAWRTGRLRLGLSLSAFTDGSWSRPNGMAVTVVPTLGVGFGREYVR